MGLFQSKNEEYEKEVFEEGSYLDLLNKELKWYGFHSIQDKKLFDKDRLLVDISKRSNKTVYELKLHCMKDNVTVYYKFEKDFKKLADLVEFLQNIETTHIVKDGRLVSKEVEENNKKILQKKDELNNFLLGNKN
jgi:hypothetical protein